MNFGISNYGLEKNNCSILFNFTHTFIIYSRIVKGMFNMGSSKFCLYVKDETLAYIMRNEKNKSAYVERAIRFYEDNKDIIPKLAKTLLVEETRNN